MEFATLQAAFAAALQQTDLPAPDSITTARGAPDAGRISVYRNNIFVSLSKALAQRFPVTERLVGTEFFAAMAVSFVQGHKPASPLLMNYGEDFPAFVAAFGPAASLPYLSDVARIEAACTRAYHAADAVPLTVEGLANIVPGDLPGLGLVPHPSVSLVSSRFPVGSIWVAHQTAEVTPVTVSFAETVLVLRPDLSVGVHVLPSGDAQFAEALLSGCPFGKSAEAALARNPDFDFGTALVRMITLGAFSALCPKEGADR